MKRQSFLRDVLSCSLRGDALCEISLISTLCFFFLLQKALSSSFRSESYSKKCWLNLISSLLFFSVSAFLFRCKDLTINPSISRHCAKGSSYREIHQRLYSWRLSFLRDVLFYLTNGDILLQILLSSGMVVDEYVKASVIFYSIGSKINPLLSHLVKVPGVICRKLRNCLKKLQYLSLPKIYSCIFMSKFCPSTSQSLKLTPFRACVVALLVVDILFCIFKKLQRSLLNSKDLATALQINPLSERVAEF